MPPTRVPSLVLLLCVVLLGACGEAPVAPGPAAVRPAPSLAGGTAGRHDDDDDEDEAEDDDDDDEDRARAPGATGDDDDSSLECDDDTDDDEEPCFLDPARGGARLAQGSASFWAVRGQLRSGAIWYRARPGSRDSTPAVRLSIPPGALQRRPDGTPIAIGDSLLVTITVIDTARLGVALAPAGLRFASGAPATLALSYAGADDDVNGDGDVDDDDERLTSRLLIWRRDGAGAPWTVIASTVNAAAREVRAALSGFSHYIIAY